MMAEVKIYGNWHWLNVLKTNENGDIATVKLPGCGTRELPVVFEDGHHRFDSCVIAR
jgi:hypothetical protein